MRVKDWDQLNGRALSRVSQFEQRVELLYQTSDEVLTELERLVAAEQGCCGAAGVNFDLHRLDAGARVVIRAANNGLPARTVMATFAAMVPANKRGQHGV